MTEWQKKNEEETLDAADIIPPHEITDDRKFEEIAASMADNGWDGRPLLVLDCADHYKGLTGSHRIAAAQEAGCDVQALVMSVPTADENDESELYFELANKCSSDEERLGVLCVMRDAGLVSAACVELMEMEILAQ